MFRRIEMGYRQFGLDGSTPPARPDDSSFDDARRLAKSWHDGNKEYVLQEINNRHTKEGIAPITAMIMEEIIVGHSVSEALRFSGFISRDWR